MKINWTLVGLAAAAVFLMKKKPAEASEAAPSTTDAIKTQVLMGDIDTGDEGGGWIPGAGY